MNGKYWFFRTPRPGVQSLAVFSTFRQAWDSAQVNGNPQIWFMDSRGQKHRCEAIRGQEGDDEILHPTGRVA